MLHAHRLGLRTNSCAPNSVHASVEVTPIKYALHRSKLKRFKNAGSLTAAPDIIYDTDALSKKSLYTSMLESPIAYRWVPCATKVNIWLSFSDTPLGPHIHISA